MSTNTKNPEKPGPYDPLKEDAKPGAIAGDAESFQRPPLGRGNGKNKEAAPPPYELLDLKALLSYEEQPGEVLCGDAILEAGEFAMLFGFPSVGKSWAIMDLMVKAAWGRGRWLGHEIKCSFSTLWIGDENNKRRLAGQLKAMHAAGLLPDDFARWIHISGVPETMDVGDHEFMAHTRRIIEEKGIKLVILDTVSSAVVDETAKDFALMFRGMKGISHGLQVRPCWLLVHHRRKPKSEDSDGMGRLHQISGHQTLRRKPRTIIELERVSEQPGDRRVVATLLKNSNGKSEGEKHALQQIDTGFSEIENFDFSQCMGGGGGLGGHNKKITEQHIRDVFDNSNARLKLKVAASKLIDMTGVRSPETAYKALRANGPFGHMLNHEGEGKKAEVWLDTELWPPGDNEQSDD